MLGLEEQGSVLTAKMVIYLTESSNCKPGPAVARCVTSKHGRQLVLFVCLFVVVFFFGFANDRCSFLNIFLISIAQRKKTNRTFIWKWTNGRPRRCCWAARLPTHLPQLRVWRDFCQKNYLVNEVVSNPVGRMARTSCSARKASFQRFYFRKPRQTFP